MSLPPLPLTVIGGYLGAGKTTLINRMLRAPGGRRIMVMVNDFGAINIDAELIEAAEGDMMSLTNGCVCCTMGADLFMALGDALDRRPRPDHLVIEASGIADPSRIAMAARAEPELAYDGIVTVVDGGEFPRLAADAQIGPQIEGQVRAADLVLVTKGGSADLDLRLSVLSGAPVARLEEGTDATTLLLGQARDAKLPVEGRGHAAHVSWQGTGPVMDRATLEARLAARPPGLYRLKGWVRAPEGGVHEVQVVGAGVTLRHLREARETQLVGIGLRGTFDPAEADRWWRGG